MAERLLDVQVTQGDDGVVVIRCIGDLDMSTCDELIERIESSYTPRLRRLRIDLTAVGFTDSTGLHCMMDAQKRCAQLGIRLEVIPSEPVLQLLRLTGLDGHIDLGERSDPTTA